ncbi:Alpha/Beta hydrolase protein [Suillus clintonianus]|uniref:Alpha/Beta hydrolase protein n=1 Tax=Suillus clintonianus TaxID=1904413 RepID=UPI001B87562C|nr:Alpha/Beta hydrolase protein [Suillus clintonianus]KAG2123830.1 Alpha/Beta hydrolase protein [Suillus clintonianus]
MFTKGRILCFALTAGATTQSFLGLGMPSHETPKQKSFPQSYIAAYDDGLFTPFEQLGALSEVQFTTLGHPVFPHYSVRIKKSSNFCDGTVKRARHLFFYFFESRNDPDKDDVIFWTNGGPGCSSNLGVYMELGPCRILDDNGTVFHPESWNSNANIFFVDQPIGTGFSYAEYGQTVSTTEEAAKDVAAFIAIFFENFTQFRGRALHMASESYGGRYIPVFAAEVYDQNAMLIAAGITPISLQSIMIGNGLTDFYTMLAACVDTQCTGAAVFPVQSISACIRMKQALPRCQKWLTESCINQFDTMNCQAASIFCETEIFSTFFSTGKNPYDISKDCDGPIEETMCYPVTKHISSFLDRPSVREKLGVDPSVTGNFSFCSATVRQAFVSTVDEYHATDTHVAALLERGVRALIFVGSYDWFCNWIGVQAWTLNMEWSGKEAFGQQPLRSWQVEGQVVGQTRSAKGLTFATVDGAGHMVPYDKTKEALAMVQRWLAGIGL